MPHQDALTGQRGFIALYALLSLAFLVAVTVLAMAHWDGMVQTLRRQGGQAQAEREAFGFIQARLAEEWMAVPKPWVPPLQGEEPLPDGCRLRWARRPLEGRWRAGARPWNPELQEALARLGARRDRLATWTAWLERRQSDPQLTALGKGDLVADRAYLQGIFFDLGLAERWGGADRLWTADEGGSLGRLNLLGADPQALAALSGVDKGRIEAFQAMAGAGLADPGAALGFWRYEEGQALERWAAARPFTESLWRVEAQLPTFREPILTHWRVSLEDGTPGNPWFRVQARTAEAW